MKLILSSWLIQVFVFSLSSEANAQVSPPAPTQGPVSLDKLMPELPAAEGAAIQAEQADQKADSSPNDTAAREQANQRRTSGEEALINAMTR